MKKKPCTTPPPIVVDKHTLTKRLTRAQIACHDMSLKNPEKVQPKSLTEKDLSQISELLIQTFDPPSEIQKPESLKTRPLQLEDTQFLRREIQKLLPDISPAQSQAFAQELVITLKEKHLAEKLIKINQEILAFEAQRQKLCPIRATLPHSPPHQIAAGWMKTIEKVAAQTENPNILKLLNNTEKRVRENLTTELLTKLKTDGLALAKQPEQTYSPSKGIPIKNIPPSHLPVTKQIAQQVKEMKKIPESPLLQLAKLLFLGLSPTQLNPQLLREKSERNIQTGKRNIAAASHKLDPLAPIHPKTQQSPCPTL